MHNYLRLALLLNIICISCSPYTISCMISLLLSKWYDSFLGPHTHFVLTCSDRFKRSLQSIFHLPQPRAMMVTLHPAAPAVNSFLKSTIRCSLANYLFLSNIVILSMHPLDSIMCFHLQLT